VDLVEYLFRKYWVEKGKILDPFAGAGTALFVCSSLGYHSEGIELLPIGQKAVTRLIRGMAPQPEHIKTGTKEWQTKS
jgi:hypothetical protein